MTKAMYLDMCKALGSEPIEDEVPVELEELPLIVQQAFQLYSAIPDEWEYFGGNYIGKRIEALPLLYDLYQIPEDERLVVYKLILLIDRTRKELIKEAKPAK